MNAIAHTLYIVATPIGHRDDISLRAIDTLKNCGRIYAEDTRHSRPLLQHHGIDTPLYSLHEHNEQARIAAIIEYLKTHGSVSLISDAGTPLISDPGYRIVRAVQEHGFKVSPIPGPSALTAALSVAGLPTDRFLFAGFPPSKKVARQQWLSEFVEQNYTLVLYESPHRVLDTLGDIVAVFGAERELAFAREITKRFETVKRGTASALLEMIEQDAQQQKGEFVLLISGKRDSAPSLSEGYLDVQQVLQKLMRHLPLKLAVKCASDISELPKKDVYAIGLALQDRTPNSDS